MSRSDAETLADALVDELPEAERDEARRFASERVVPIAVAEAGDDPDRLLLVYQRLADRVGSASPEHRFAALRQLADEVEMEDLNRAALSLAIARYLDDGHDIGGAARWVSPEIEALRERGGIEEEATRRLQALDAWKARVPTQHPDVWASYRSLALRAGLALSSARTGSFETATGSLFDFLEDAGAPVQHFDVF